MPVAGVVGIRFALEPGRGRTAVPVRSALLGTVLAVALVVATLTFASSSEHPGVAPGALRVELELRAQPEQRRPAASPEAARPRPRRRRLERGRLQRRRDRRPDRPRPHGTRTDRGVSPPVLSGHGLEANNQIVMGAATLAVLHKHVGDTVSVSYGTPRRRPALRPAHPLDDRRAPRRSRRWASTASSPTTPRWAPAPCSPRDLPAGVPTGRAVARTRTSTARSWSSCGCGNGVSPAAGRADMQRIANAADKVFGCRPQCLAATTSPSWACSARRRS